MNSLLMFLIGIFVGVNFSLIVIMLAFYNEDKRRKQNEGGRKLW